METEKEQPVPRVPEDPLAPEEPSTSKVKFDETTIQVTDLERDSGQEQEDEYLEVRSAVDLTDDVNMPAETFRAYAIGILFTCIGAAVSNVTDLREQPLVIDSGVVQLISLPIGKFWARYMPDIRVGFGRWSFKLNPGPFTIKEHALIVIMANVGVGWPPYAVGLLIVQLKKFNQNFGFMYGFLLCLTTEMLGYGFAGLCRRWLLYPKDMIWPSQLSTSAFLNTMHRDKNPRANGWTISRYHLFFLSLVAMFGYSFLPQLVPALSGLNLLPMIWPQNKIINCIFGLHTGLAFLPLTLSYQTVVAFLGQPQVVPVTAHYNILTGMIFWFWIVAGIMYAKNHWWSQYFPVGSPAIFDNRLKSYNVNEIMTPDKRLDIERYRKYSPLFQGPRIALAYALSFASISCLFVHTLLNDGKFLLSKLRFRRNRDEEDVHMIMMRNYPEVPEWWYQVLLVILFALSMVTIAAWPTHLPWWGFLITLSMPILFMLPIGIIAAKTNQEIGLNVITEFVAGYIWPGRPVANVLVKTYGYITMSKGLRFVSDLKLGMYIKVPPRATFRFQLVGSVISNVTAVLVITSIIGSVSDLCEDGAKSGFTCPGLNVFYRAAIIWGAIAPDRIFSPKAPYGDSMWYFLIGAIAPIPVFLAQKYWPRKKWLKAINMPLFFSGSGMIPPATPLHYFNWAAVGIFFNGWVMKRYPAWWGKYNYILGTGLQLGTVFTELVFSFVGLGGYALSDFATDALTARDSTTLDSKGQAIFKTLGEGEFIGPSTWN